MKLERWLLEVWYGDRGRGWWLAPFGSLMRLVSGSRRFLYQHGWLRSTTVNVPVIVIGNITVGGTGKTPLVIWLANRLSQAGLRVGVLTRGYGARVDRHIAAPGTASDQADPALVGDEAVLIASKTDAAVVVGPERVSGARQLEQQKVQVIICDDGLQHYRLDRAVEIAVIDGERGFGNGRFIPAGPLREAPQRLQSVDAVVVNGQVEAGRWPGALTMEVVGDRMVSLSSGEPCPLAEMAGKPAHAVAGIGNPQRFFDLLRAHDIEFRPHVFPDHASYTADDLRFDEDWPIMMTEKDAVKCVAFANDRMWSVPVEARFTDADAAALLDLISNATGLKMDDGSDARI